MTQQITLNGNLYSDDGSVGRGMADGGFRENLVPMCGDLIVVMTGQVAEASAEVGEATNQAEIATAQAAIAVGAAVSTVTGPGSTGTSTTNMAVGLGLRNFTIQPGKTLYKGMPIVIAASASPDDAMYGPLMSYDPATGATLVKVTALHMAVPGTFITSANWTVSLTGAAAVWALINELAGAPIPSAPTINLATATGNHVHITGNAGPVTAITIPQGAARSCVLDSNPTLVHSDSLILPGEANIVAAAGDSFVVRGEGGGVAHLVSYTRANGDALFIRKQFRTVMYLATSGSYVAPADGVLRITLRGADGSGAIAISRYDTTASAAASGAGAGGLSIKTLRVKAGDTFSALLAAGGSQVSAVVNQGATNGMRINGNAGGDSSVVGPNTSMVAAGGAGGLGAFAATGPVSAAGALGGVASGGDENYSGGNSGAAVVTVGSGVVATGGGAVGWNGVGYSSGSATVSEASGNPAGAASGGAGSGGASGAALASAAATGAVSGGAGAAGPSLAVTNAQGTAGPGMPAVVSATPLSLTGAGNSLEGGAGGNGFASTSSGATGTAGGPLAGGGAAVCFGANSFAVVTAKGGSGGSTGGAAVRASQNGQTSATSQAGADAFVIFEWAKT
jgi:hypothetical protein